MVVPKAGKIWERVDSVEKIISSFLDKSVEFFPVAENEQNQKTVVYLRIPPEMGVLIETHICVVSYQRKLSRQLHIQDS